MFVCGSLSLPASADVAQLVEQLICNHQVVSSNLIIGSSLNPVKTIIYERQKTALVAVFCVVD